MTEAERFRLFFFQETWAEMYVQGLCDQMDCSQYILVNTAFNAASSVISDVPGFIRSEVNRLKGVQKDE
jgi:hypothetical protein